MGGWVGGWVYLHGFQHALQEGNGGVAAQGGRFELCVGECLAEVFALFAAVRVPAGALDDLVFVCLFFGKEGWVGG